MNSNETPWFWKDERIFGPASQYNFLDHLGINITNSSSLDIRVSPEHYFEESPESFIGISTGIVLVLNLFFSTKAKHDSTKTARKINSVPGYYKPIILSAICFIISVIISPIVFTILTIFTTYRLIIYMILRHKFGTSFVGLLEGTDVMWAVEDTSKSVINILAIVECDKDTDLVSKLREKMAELITKQCYKKLSYRREKMYGYYFWKEIDINIEDHVRNIDVKNKSNVSLQDTIGKYSNSNLPENHKALWEILVEKNYNDSNEKTDICILFRVHHSVGDGLALLTVLLEAMADKKNVNVKTNLKTVARRLSYDVKIIRISYSPKHVTTAKEMEQVTNKLVKFRENMCAVFRNVFFIIFGPGCLLYQGLARVKDESLLHGPTLTGEKLTAWLVEGENQMFDAIKRIKKRINGVTFTEVLLTATSASFYDYFQKKSREEPEFVTAVVPARIELQSTPEQIGANGSVKRQDVSGSCHLRNRFSVAMLNLPMFPRAGSGSDLVQRLSDVRSQTAILRNSSDYVINYWLLRVVSKVLPESILRPMVYSAHSTMVISNIPGPSKISICGGNALKNLVFWVPNRGLTGIGVSILSYGERIQLGLLADKALIKNIEDAQMILENISKYIRKLEDISLKGLI